MGTLQAPSREMDLQAHQNVKVHFPNLDGLRTIAIIPVLLFHSTYGAVPGGFLGVDLFFTLSGFLITALLYQELQDTGTIDLRRFYIRRALRLLPALALSIILARFLWPLTVDKDANFPLALLSVVFYFSNFIPAQLGSLGSCWSLAVEEQYYLIWPPVIIWLFQASSGKKDQICFALILMTGAALAFRTTMFFEKPDLFDLYRFTLSRVDSICIGSLVALTPILNMAS